MHELTKALVYLLLENIRSVVSRGKIVVQALLISLIIMQFSFIKFQSSKLTISLSSATLATLSSGSTIAPSD